MSALVEGALKGVGEVRSLIGRELKSLFEDRLGLGAHTPRIAQKVRSETPNPAHYRVPMVALADHMRRGWALHYVTAREMYNVARAAMDGKSGDPSAYFDDVVPPPPVAA